MMPSYSLPPQAFAQNDTLDAKSMDTAQYIDSFSSPPLAMQ